MVLMSDVETMNPFSYAERSCAKCTARMTQERDRRGRSRWTCTSCGKRTR